MDGGGRIVDSAMAFDEAVSGTGAPPEVIAALRLIEVDYRGFDGRLHRGQLVVHRDLAKETGELFIRMAEMGFPVTGAVPIVRFGWSDEASMAADNSSAFNYRVVAGTDRLSLHAAGRAVDINPLRNPAIYPDGRIAPAAGVYRPGAPGTLTAEHPLVHAFEERGWRWGGRFGHVRDHHHFEK